MDALPDLSQVDERVAKDAETNGWAQVAGESSWLDRDAAGAMARAASTGDASKAPAAAVRVPESQALVWLDGKDAVNPLINPTRCVWVVTVNAPWQPSRVPPFAKPRMLTGAGLDTADRNRG